ncbi:unnamed protein product, partial [Polarella glacialis]
DLVVRAGAARACGALAGDAVLMTRLQGFAADALLEACSDAVAGAAARSLAERRELLAAAVGSLRKVLHSQ